VLLGLVVTTNAMETICCTSSEVKVTHSLMCLPVWLSASDAVLEDLSLASRTCVWPRGHVLGLEDMCLASTILEDTLTVKSLAFTLTLVSLTL